jgi:hypothetical protein
VLLLAMLLPLLRLLLPGRCMLLLLLGAGRVL